MKTYRAQNYLYGEPLEIIEMKRPYLSRKDVKFIKSFLDMPVCGSDMDKVEVFLEPGHKRIMVITAQGIER